MSPRHGWVYAPTPTESELVRFLRHANTMFHYDEAPGWSPDVFVQSALIGFNSLVIGESHDPDHVLRICDTIRRNSERLRTTFNRLCLITSQLPHLTVQQMQAAGVQLIVA